MKKEKYSKLQTDLESALKKHKQSKNWKEEVANWKEVKAAYLPLKEELITQRKQVREKIK